MDLDKILLSSGFSYGRPSVPFLLVLNTVVVDVGVDVVW